MIGTFRFDSSLFLLDRTLVTTVYMPVYSKRSIRLMLSVSSLGIMRRQIFFQTWALRNMDLFPRLLQYRWRQSDSHWSKEYRHCFNALIGPPFVLIKSGFHSLLTSSFQSIREKVHLSGHSKFFPVS